MYEDKCKGVTVLWRQNASKASKFFEFEFKLAGSQASSAGQRLGWMRPLEIAGSSPAAGSMLPNRLNHGQPHAISLPHCC
jgi:hypothetical protein